MYRYRAVGPSVDNSSNSHVLLLNDHVIVNAFDHSRTFAHIKELHIPTVLIDLLTTQTLPLVSLDNVQGTCMATAYAIE